MRNTQLSETHRVAIQRLNNQIELSAPPITPPVLSRITAPISTNDTQPLAVLANQKAYPIGITSTTQQQQQQELHDKQKMIEEQAQSLRRLREELDTQKERQRLREDDEERKRNQRYVEEDQRVQTNRQPVLTGQLPEEISSSPENEDDDDVTLPEDSPEKGSPQSRC